MTLSVTLPIRLISEANAHTHWRTRQKRAKAQRATAALMLQNVHGFSYVNVNSTAPIVVTMIRIAPRSLDSDNAVGACKHLRDGIADWLGIKDNDPRVEWVVKQEKGKPKEYAARIEIRCAQKEAS